MLTKFGQASGSTDQSIHRRLKMRQWRTHQRPLCVVWRSVNIDCHRGAAGVKFNIHYQAEAQALSAMDEKTKMVYDAFHRLPDSDGLSGGRDHFNFNERINGTAGSTLAQNSAGALSTPENHSVIAVIEEI